MLCTVKDFIYLLSICLLSIDDFLYVLESIEIKPISYLVFMMLSVADVIVTGSTVPVEHIDTQRGRLFC